MKQPNVSYVTQVYSKAKAYFKAAKQLSEGINEQECRIAWDVI